MSTHSSTRAWKIPWMEEPGRLQTMESWESDTTEQLHFHFSLTCIGEGNGNPLQCSCLENPRGGRAWWAAVYGVAQSRTWLKQLSSSSSSSSNRPVATTFPRQTPVVSCHSQGRRGQGTTGMLQRWGSNFCTEIQLLWGYRSGAILHCELLGLLFSVTQPSSSNSEYLKLYYVRKLRNT